MPTATRAADNSARAVAAYNAMQGAYYQPSRKLYREYHPYDRAQDNPYGYLWSFEEAAKATLSMYGMPGEAATYASAVQDRLRGREEYWDGAKRQRGYRSYPGNGDRYYDDNCWAASDLLQHHLLTSQSANSTALDRAQGVFTYIQTGWTTTLPKPGGVRWVDAAFNGDRATNATGGWAELGAHLYDITGRRTQAYLDRAIDAYNWTTQYLLASNGLYANSVRADGNVDATQWIYNQGILIGAGVLLHRVTGNPTYLAEATRVADAALAFYATDAFYSGMMGAYSGRAIFNAIFFRNLLLLYSVQRNAAYLEKMQAYADAVWSDSKAHDPDSNLYQLNGEPRRSLLDQSAMVQVFALLSWDPKAYSLLA